MAYSRDTLLAELERDEGLKLRPYTDTVGKLTIGCGRNLTDVGISADEARAMLKADVDRAEKALDRIAPWWRNLSDNRQRVLLNMAFNLGETRLANFKKMLAALSAGEYDRAATEMKNSLWAEQVKDRAKRLADLMAHG